MAFKVEVEQRRRWWQRWWVWLLLLAVAGQVTAIIVPSLEREQAREQAGRVPVVPPVPELTLSCGGDQEYRSLSEVKQVVVIVAPTGKNCWTAWLRRPEKARSVKLDPESDIDEEWAFGDGKISQRHDSPLINWSNSQVMNAVRFQNPGDRPVRIPITIANY